MSSIIHLVTLPLDGMPVFESRTRSESSNFLKRGDSDRAKEILRAAALTYLAGSLMSLLNIARWWTILRHGVPYKIKAYKISIFDIHAI